MLGQIISNRWPAESLPRSMWVKKFNLQSNFMYIHLSHNPNPPKCIVDTADIWKTLDVFYIYLCYYISIYIYVIYFVNDLSKSNWRNSLSSLKSVWAILLHDVSTEWWLFLVPGMILTLQSNPPGQYEHWPFLPDLHQKNVIERISLTHSSNIDW